MKKEILITVCIGILFLLTPISLFGNKLAPVTEDEKKIIEKTIDNSIEWAKTKDINLLYSIIANDTEYVEVDPENRVVIGFNEFKKAEKFWMHPDFKSIRHEIKDLKITLSQKGDVAWFYCMLDDINEWKGQSASWINTRWTGGT